jgi:pimeloyl-ACP methyl ester carboxylesterase
MSNVLPIAGVDVHVEGDGAEAIVMIHGWPDTYRLWDAQVHFLKDRYRCVRFTLPGFDAAHPRHAWSLAEVTSVVERIVEQVCPGQRVTLLLHDWGCVFGYEFYLRNPRSVSRIIGVDVGDQVSLLKARTRRESLCVFAYQGWLALAWRVGGRAGDWMTRTMARWLRCPSPRASMHSGMSYPYFVQWFGGRRSYRRHVQAFVPSCPTLFVYGRRKPLMFHAKAWAEELSKGEDHRVVAFDTGHWVMAEQPDRFNQLVSDWLSAVPARALER